MKDLGTLRYGVPMPDQPDAGRRRVRPRRALLVALGLLVPAAFLAIGIAISMRQPSAGVATTVTTTAGFTPAGSTPAGSGDVPGKAPHRSRRSAPLPEGPGVLVALLDHPTALRATPGGHSLTHLDTKTQFGSPEVLWVVTHVPGWLGVMTPQAGNNRVAWIAQSSASLRRETWELKVSLAARQLTVLDGGRVVVRYTVAIGQPDAPTPTGRFAVTDRLLTGDPEGPYGCCILALNAHSPHAIQGWTGGTRIAIHSTPEATSIGEAASHGCVRVTLAEGRWLLNHIPLGTPTLISS
jgi:lipoprotein-anchoring transpeptidase ErfK/SrfK